MKMSSLFILLSLAISFAEPVKNLENKVVCVKRNDTLKLLQGRDGRSGPSGPQGERGVRGVSGIPGVGGEPGLPGSDGTPGQPGEKGNSGLPGQKGKKGEVGIYGVKGDVGVQGEYGITGELGYSGEPGHPGHKGDRGDPGERGEEFERDFVFALLNDYYVSESGYYNNLYHVSSRELTDGRTDTGGWGSKTASPGNYLQAAYVRPVFVTSVTLGGGFIPSWSHDIKEKHGKMDLLYSKDGRKWFKVATFPSPAAKQTITHKLPFSVTAKYWRLSSAGKNWVGTTEFALKPLIKSS